MRLFACVLAAVAALQSQPTFRTGVELIRIDVTVLDKAGQPVTGLQPETSRSRLTGRRAGSRLPPSTVRPRRAAGSFPCSNVATNKDAGPGRVVVFVVDLEA